MQEVFRKNKPTRASFRGGRAVVDIYDSNGVKWIARGQLVSEKQIEVALVKGSLTKATFDTDNIYKVKSSQFDLKPTFADVIEVTDQIAILDKAKNQALQDGGSFSPEVVKTISDSTQNILKLLQHNQFSPYKLIGLTSFLYQESRFKQRRPQLKTLHNTGTQHLLFKDILGESLHQLVNGILLNPLSWVVEQQSQLSGEQAEVSVQEYKQLCEQATQRVLAATHQTELDKTFITDLVKYFTPHQYFTSAELRLFQQINQYINFAMPELVTEQLPFEPNALPMINFANYFKQAKMGGGMGIEGTRLVQYIGLIPSGTAIQFKNLEKGIVIAPKSRDVLYAAVITGMDGQPLLTPSLREIKFRDLNHSFKLIPSHDLPLRYEDHAHEKIWKMHIVQENLKHRDEQ